MAWDPARLFPAFARAGMLHTCTYQPLDAPRRAFQAGLVQPDTELADGLVQSAEMVIEYQTACAPDLAAGVTVTLCGQRFTVLGSPRRQGDGFFSRAALSPYGRGTQGVI